MDFPAATARRPHEPETHMNETALFRAHALQALQIRIATAGLRQQTRESP
jgi:hypothetical protein